MTQNIRRGTNRNAPLNQTGEIPAYTSTPSTQIVEPSEIIEEIQSRAPASGETLRALAEIVMMVLIVYAILTFFFTSVRIVGTVMEPTFSNGQQILVSRATYLLSAPQRGDVIILQDPLSSARIVTRRVIGLPGEKVEVRGRQVIVNNQPLNEPYVSVPLLAGESVTSVVAIQLATDELYVLADNRLSLNDSRTWGPVKLGTVIGRAWLIYWPPDRIGLVQHARYTQEVIP
ncbi:MAG: signal peptidase I [Anaerolineae bacterium]|nr:signal peptidase I [Thermoflexales bacterium]MDW8407765.1 signal peptidase I [Anaerolineae bacterium]